MAEVLELQCRECGRGYPVSPIYACEFCFAPLEPTYDYDAIRAAVSAERIGDGPPTIWRYEALLPELDRSKRVDLGAGFTPLVKADRLASYLGIDELYLKNDTANPTHSFKDRVVTVALSAARSMGFNVIACASTGNLANAVAAHAARSGMTSFVFIPSDLEEAKIVTTAIYGGNVIAVKGNYDDVNRLCSEIAQTVDWAFVNVNIRPFYSEGSKTLAFEVCEQLGWQAPDHMVVPVASGSLLTKINKGLHELETVGLIPRPSTKIHAAQAAGCNPVTDAVTRGIEHVRPVKPNTIAKSLAIGNPADGYYAVKAVRETGGFAQEASDEDIVAGIRLLASTEGIFTETAGGVTISVLEKLAAAGTFAKGERVVAMITGMGLKTAEAITGKVGATVEIPPNLEAFEEQLGFLEGDR
ncbi:MAG: threonine synthase [Actinobacteria bacterium]|nr:threonine synthase [Actinomycetota bacterium]